jgi:hypothetical protein
MFDAMKARRSQACHSERHGLRKDNFMTTSFAELLQRQKRHFATGVTRSYEWRIEQLDRMARMINENEAALQSAVASDFKTASQEHIFETQACLGEIAFQKSQLRDWMTPTEGMMPKAARQFPCEHRDWLVGPDSRVEAPSGRPPPTQPNRCWAARPLPDGCF